MVNSCTTGEGRGGEGRGGEGRGGEAPRGLRELLCDDLQLFHPAAFSLSITLKGLVDLLQGLVGSEKRITRHSCKVT